MSIEEEKARIKLLEDSLAFHQYNVDRIKQALVEMKKPKFVDAKQILADLDRREAVRRRQPKPKVAKLEPKPAKQKKVKSNFFTEIEGL